MAYGAVLRSNIFAVVAAWWILKYRKISTSAAIMGPYSDVDDLINRVVVFVIAAMAIGMMLLTVPNRKIPLLTMFGRNSLLIYLAHRFVTIVYYREIFTHANYTYKYIVYAFIASVLTCIVFGNEKLNTMAVKLVNNAAEKMLDNGSKFGNALKFSIGAVFVILLAVSLTHIV